MLVKISCRVIAIVLSVALAVSCAQRKNGSGELKELTTDSVPPVHNMGDWLTNQKEQIQIMWYYLQSLKKVANGVAAYKKTKGLRLTSSSGPTAEELKEMITVEAKRMENMASATKLREESVMASIAADAGRISNAGASSRIGIDARKASADLARMRSDLSAAYARNANIPIENQLKNTSSALGNERKGIDNMGARIDNVGKVLTNESKRLDNVLKELEIFLKQQYAIAYSTYVKSYHTYSKEIIKIMKMTGRVNTQMGRALGSIYKFERQSRVCESRRKRLSHHKFVSANEEVRNKQVYYYKIPQIANALASTLKGEACLHKVLLTSTFADAKELFNVGYKVVYSGESKPEIMCPVLAEQVGPEGLSVMDYPYPMIDQTTFEVTGYFHPLTYYQVYRLITESENDIAFASPLDHEQVVCNRRNPGTTMYRSESAKVEEAIGAEIPYDISTLKIENSGYTSYSGRIPSKNQSYRKLVDRFTDIFRLVDTCIKTAEVPVPLPVTPGAEGGVNLTDGTPGLGTLVVGQPASSDMAAFTDPDFPEMSESIRECMRQAEHYRWKAYEYIAVTDKMLEVMKKAQDMKPPRAPHPVSFQPVGANPNVGNQ